jgi:hypothetical protein
VTFHDVDANNLDLYVIPIPDGDEQLEEALRHWTATDESRLKGILKPLSSQNLSGSFIFPNTVRISSCIFFSLRSLVQLNALSSVPV